MTPSPRPRRRPGVHTLCAALLGGLTLTIALSGCAGGPGASSQESAPRPAAAGAPGRAASVQDGDAARTVDTTQARRAAAQRSVISKGTVVLRSADVAGARFDVRQIADQYGGEVSDEQTDTDADGEVVTAHLVLRIPSSDFGEAMADLEDVADLAFSGRSAKDVTTQVIDTRVRLRAQRRSIARIETLLDRARNLRDIVLIESQLTRRQADLDSLEQQSEYLQDQTSLATITVDIDHEGAATQDEDRTGFLAGLAAGWHGLVAVAVGLATAAGALLPWLAVLLLLAIPGRPLVQRLRRHRKAPVEAPAEA
jgi:uncharacterized protein DUF4349